MTPAEAEAKYRAEWPTLNALKEAAMKIGDKVGAKRARQRLSALSVACAARHNNQTPSADELRRAKIIKMARDQNCEDEINVDDDAQLSEGDANGTWVGAWVWVDFEDTEFDKEK